MEATLATIAALYPAARFFTATGARRVPAPHIVPWKGGWRSNINGEFVLFGHDGTLLSRGYQNRFTVKRMAASI